MSPLFFTRFSLRYLVKINFNGKSESEHREEKRKLSLVPDVIFEKIEFGNLFACYEVGIDVSDHG